MHAESARLCASTELPGCTLTELAAAVPSEVDGAPRGANEKFSILFSHGKTQPTSSTIDDGFPAAADKFQRVISCVCLYFRSGRDDFCGQSVKLGNVVHAQIIVAIYFDYLPLGGSNGDCGSE